MEKCDLLRDFVKVSNFIDNDDDSDGRSENKLFSNMKFNASRV